MTGFGPDEFPLAIALTGCATALLALSGVPGLFLRHRPGWGQNFAAGATVVAALAGLSSAVSLLLLPDPSSWLLDWNLPFGDCEVAVDALSALFLIPVFLVSACAAVYAIGYHPAREHRDTEPGMTFFTGILAAAMVLLLMARNGVLFIMAWEAMALSAWFLLTTDRGKPEVQRAGTVYLFATHIGTMALFVLFAVLRTETGTFGFPGIRALASAGPATAIFLLALFGFGAKAGLMPLHTWLPAAHANAPSHVSALLSGVMLKMGIYGIVRVAFLFQAPPAWWDILLVVMGAMTAVLGIAFATSQRDLKRMLACSSIENIGIITLGLGLGMAGIRRGNTTLALLGVAGAFLHVLNHSLFKPLLFLGSGALIHATGTREIDRMGGLAKRMPTTALLFLVGSAAICGLPPLNGFVGEFLIYLGIFSDARGAAAPWPALLAPVLALVGGIAAIGFVKLYGIAFLGNPRSPEAATGHEAGKAMLLPMALLAILCCVVGVVPQPIIRLVEPAASSLMPWPPAPGGAISALPSIGWLSVASGGLLVLVALVALLFRRRLAAAPSAVAPTWGCGYLAPSPRVQYTGTSFSELLVNLFEGAVRPERTPPILSGLAPGASRFRFTPTETILDRMLFPAFSVAAGVFAFIHRLQHGQMHIYMLYIFVTLFLLMIWAH